MDKKLFSLHLVLFICIGSVFSQQNSSPSENCIRCLCHARTGCFILRNCASYSISQDYWTQAGRPTVLDDDPNNAMSYTKCMQSDTCIMETIRGYIDSKVIKDCDCDNQITCKDFAAIHLKGDQCQSSFDAAKLNRLDQCLSSGRGAGISNTPGWNFDRCTRPMAQDMDNKICRCGSENQDKCQCNIQDCKKSFKISTDAVLGRHLVATRVIQPGEIVIKEAPLISGPPQLTAPVCLGVCEKPLQPPLLKNCDACGWPLCGAERCRTAQEHLPECFYTQKRGVKISVNNYVFPHPNYQCITVLRLLYQRDHNPKIWNKLKSFQSHCNERKGSEKYESDRVSVAQFIRRFFKLQDIFSEEEILWACGILQVNGHEVPLTEPPYVAIYNEASMLEHNCRPNCCKSFTSSGELLIIAAQQIEPGAHLTITYTDSLWSTPNRRHYLFETKFFACSCNRCSDPTEYGTYFSALKCANKECKGFVLPSTFLIDPRPCKESKETTWNCSVCDRSMSSTSINTILERIGRDLNAMQKGDPQSCKIFLEYYERLLHPNHGYLTDVRIALAHLIGQENENGLQNTPLEEVQFKLQLCTRLVDLLKILNPAELRVRGTLLFELHAAIAEIARRKAASGEMQADELRAMLQRSRDILAAALHLLQHEPNELPEGQIYIQAETNLETMNQLLRTLHTNIGDSII